MSADSPSLTGGQGRRRGRRGPELTGLTVATSRTAIIMGYPRLSETFIAGD